MTLLAILSTIILAAACAVLGVFVVMKRWALLGEGIGHAGLGGAGIAWLLAAFVPALDVQWLPFAIVIPFCLATAWAIGRISRDDRVHADSAIGIFLVASLAFGFLAQQIYRTQHRRSPHLWDTLLFGQFEMMSAATMMGVICISIAVILVVAFLGKEILYCCLDPVMARAGGVNVDAVQNLMLAMLAMLIILGMPLAGSVLVTALLILPGATSMLISRKLPVVIGIAVAIGILAALIAAGLHAMWNFVTIGPAMVLVMFVQFLAAYVFRRSSGTTSF